MTVSTVSSRKTAISPDRKQNIVDKIIERIRGLRPAMFSGYRPEEASVPQIFSKFVYMVTPAAAADLAVQGFTQKSLSQHIFDVSSVPFEELSEQEIEKIKMRIKMSREKLGLVTYHIRPEYIPVWEAGLSPGGKVPLLSSPEDIHFVVAGTGRKSVAEWSYWRSIYTWSSNGSVKIQGATLTKAGH